MAMCHVKVISGFSYFVKLSEASVYRVHSLQQKSIKTKEYDKHNF